jgi:hypothetical protein
MVWYVLDCSGLGSGIVEGSCDHGNKISGFINCWEIIECLHNWCLIKKGPAPYWPGIFNL